VNESNESNDKMQPMITRNKQQRDDEVQKGLSKAQTEINKSPEHER
jgi:hypothetical protein